MIGRLPKVIITFKIFKKKKKKKKKQLQLLLNQRFDVVSVERKGVVKGKERRSSSLSMLVKEKKRR